MASSLVRAGKKVGDWGGLETANVRYVALPDSVDELRQLIRFARSGQLNVSLRGVGHSAGGQTFADDALMIDIRRLNRISGIDPTAQRVVVQAGANWGDLTRKLEPLGLCVTTKQEFDTFTVGGSLAVNVHGKSVDYGPLIGHVESFRFLTAAGEIVTASRTENPGLFRAAIGGYGLLGVIVDATLRVVQDRIVEKTEVVRMTRSSLVASYLERVRREPAPPLCYGFLNVDCQIGFYVTYEYAEGDHPFPLTHLTRDEPRQWLFNLLVRAQRLSSKIRKRGIDLMWLTSAKPERTLRSRRLLLWDRAPKAFEGMLLQKYFVPIAKCDEFLSRVGPVFREFEDRVPLMMHHFRFVPADTESLLSFAPEDSVCLIPCYLAKKGSARWKGHLEALTHRIQEIVSNLNGRHYLTFDILGTTGNFQRFYPKWREFQSVRKAIDPSGMFINRMSEKYFTEVMEQ
jgi:decaprenylphospho-beta-D-ribofuranose 2-oxidase